LTNQVVIAVDAMGGDHGPSVTVPAVLAVLQRAPDLNVALVGQSAVINPLLSGHRFGARLRIQHAEEAVAMDERPQEALRRKKNSSMRVAIDLVKSGEAQACVSAGNTGALMATARFVLKTLPGIDRPAILSRIPARHGHTVMLDLGANADSTPEQLFQFAVMGAVVAQDLHGTARPRVALLNIGSEDIKGNETVQQAHRLLSNCTLNYTGFVEGNDIFGGDVDVVVTDGFTGNVALKTMEGVAQMFGSVLNTEFTRNIWRRMAALASLPVLRAARQRLDPREHNGASMTGLNGIVIKSHGSADSHAFGNALHVALLEARRGVPTQIVAAMEQQLAALRTRTAQFPTSQSYTATTSKPG
jgi:phosphate acyltransferase